MEDKTKSDVICPEFIGHLREERLRQQDRRASYVRLKFTFVIGLFGVAATLTKFEPNNGIFLLYLAPLVALLLDFYILGGEFAVKRIGKFLSEQDRNINGEKIWDQFFLDYPKGFMQLNRFWVTSFISLASIFPIGIHLSKENSTIFEWGIFSSWLIFIISSGFYLVLIEKNIRELFFNNRGK